MAVVSILPQVESGPNDHREDASHFIILYTYELLKNLSLFYHLKNISETSVAQVPAIGLYKKLGYQCASIYLDTKNMLKNSIFISFGITLVACYKKL